MPNYSTEKAIRSEAGFTWNNDITEALIQGYQNQATAVINGVIGKRYSLEVIRADGGFTGSPAQLTLSFVEQLLAAGYLLNKDYDIQDDDGNSNGNKKIKSAYDILQNIMSGAVALIDASGNEYATGTGGSAGSAVAKNAVGCSKFTTNQQR